MENLVINLKGGIRLNFGKVLSTMFFLFFTSMAFHPTPHQAVASDLSPAESRLKTKFQTFLQIIDSPAFAEQVSTEEFIVNAFAMINERNPDPFEFYYSKSLMIKNALTRSQFFGLLLAGAENHISWDTCRDLLKDNPLRHLINTSASRQTVQDLKNAAHETIIQAYRHRRRPNRPGSPPALATNDVSASTMPTPYQTYNTYFGYLHAHTAYSDGSGTPEEAYQYARDQAKLDFFAVTDHGELLILWPWEQKWDKIKAAADAHYSPGTFVTLWGFEWTNPILGHINILNTADYTHCLATITLDDIYEWLIKRPEGFGRFNHPGDYDLLKLEFDHLKPAGSGITSQMVGIETWNGSSGFGEYFYKNDWTLSAYSYLDTGNQNGWLLGPLGGQDNHDKSWGTKNEFRTAVLANELTRESIVEAYRSRRFYATEDSDLKLDFRCAGYPMGSQLEDIPRQFTVTASDGSNDTFAEIRFYRNGDLMAVKSVAGNPVTSSFSDESTDPAYYYVIVRQNDDNDGDGRNDEAITAPIWIE